MGFFSFALKMGITKPLYEHRAMCSERPREAIETTSSIFSFLWLFTFLERTSSIGTSESISLRLALSSCSSSPIMYTCITRENPLAVSFRIDVGYRGYAYMEVFSNEIPLYV